MALSATEKKQIAAHAAMKFIRAGSVVGVGTGSTVNALIALLGPWRARLRGAVSSSEASSERLRTLGIPLLDLNEVADLDIYIDGADEANPGRELIKGGGAALTREKIIAAAARRFICIVDDSKLVEVLGRFPLPVEVVPMARTLVTRALGELGGRAVWRAGTVTDNGNHVLDVHDLLISDPRALETAINQIVGVVTVGLFAVRPADVLVVGCDAGARTI
jgi:ribose 5-phosphate isomerase A